MQERSLKTRPLPGYMSLSAGARKTRMTLQRFTRLARIAGVDAYRIGNVIVIDEEGLSQVRGALKTGALRRGRPPKNRVQ